MPYQVGNFALAPTTADYQAALPYRLVQYYQINGDLLGGVWAVLSAGIVCLMGFQVPQSFETGVGSDGKVPAPSGNDPIVGGHVVVICGWIPDSTAPGGQGWVKLRNSWGPGMGLGGYYLMPTIYWQMGLVMDHMVLAFASPPTPPGPRPTPRGLYNLVQDASTQIKTARADPTAQWPAGTLEQADADLDAALPLIPPGPTPPTVTLQGFGGSYAGHDPAKDIYLGDSPDSGEWGQHWGREVFAPAAGTVSVYTFPTPLTALEGAGQTDAATTVRYAQEHADLFRGITGPGGCYFGTQIMYFALLTFDSPQRLANGQMCKAIWIGHCRSDIAVGRVKAGDRWCTTWCSGINFEANGIPALASHAHTCGTISGQLSMNGEVSGFLVAQLLGWQVRDQGTVPGPNDYATGQYRAGKPLSVWGGRPLPPRPPGT